MPFTLGSNMVRLNLAILCHVLCLPTHLQSKTNDSLAGFSERNATELCALMSRKRDVTDSAIFHSTLSKICHISADHI